MQKEIAVYLSSGMGATQAAKFLGVHRSMVNRWIDQTLYRPSPICPPSPETSRQLNQIVHLRPEERTDAENKKVFEFHACRDVDDFTTEEQFGVVQMDEEIVNDEAVPAEDGANAELEALLDQHMDIAARQNNSEVNNRISLVLILL